MACHSSATSEEQVAGLGAECAATSAGQLVVGEELGHRRLERAVGRRPASTPGPWRPSCLASSVRASSFLRPDVALARHADALDRAGRREGVEPGRREHVGELDQLHAEAEVGLVGAEALHGLVPRHPRDLARALAGDRLGGVEHRLGDGGEHVVLVDEAHLGVELHELVLAVGAQVLVAQAAGDLVVAVDARRPSAAA